MYDMVGMIMDNLCIILSFHKMNDYSLKTYFPGLF